MGTLVARLWGSVCYLAVRVPCLYEPMALVEVLAGTLVGIGEYLPLERGVYRGKAAWEGEGLVADM